MGRLTAYLRLLDLRKDGCFRLGISTDIVGAKRQDEARDFSQTLYDTTSLDGIVYHSRIRKENCIAIYDRAVLPNLTSGAVVQLEKLTGFVPALDDLGISLIA